MQSGFNGLYCNTCAAQACLLDFACNITAKGMPLCIGLKSQVNGHIDECILEDFRNLF